MRCLWQDKKDYDWCKFYTSKCPFAKKGIQTVCKGYKVEGSFWRSDKKCCGNCANMHEGEPLNSGNYRCKILKSPTGNDKKVRKSNEGCEHFKPSNHD
jgi:hypothetical protein